MILHAYWLGTDGVEYSSTIDHSYVYGYSGTENNVIIQPYYNGKKVALIGFRAFHNCNNLKTVYYKGTALQWDSILIDDWGNGNDDLLYSATRYYYSETQPTTYGYFWHYVGGKPTAW